MKHLLSASLVMTSSIAAAESLCGRTDAAGLLAALAGDWSGGSDVWIEADTISTGDTLGSGVTGLTEAGLLSPHFLDAFGAANLPVTFAIRYDVDAVDRLLETTESAWMADALSDTPCGPEALPQMSAAVDLGPDLTGTVTVIAYFSDRLLMLMELETRGDWGFAEVTVSSLLERPVSR